MTMTKALAPGELCPLGGCTEMANWAPIAGFPHPGPRHDGCRICLTFADLRAERPDAGVASKR